MFFLTIDSTEMIHIDAIAYELLRFTHEFSSNWMDDAVISFKTWNNPEFLSNSTFMLGQTSKTTRDYCNDRYLMFKYCIQSFA